MEGLEARLAVIAAAGGNTSVADAQIRHLEEEVRRG